MLRALRPSHASSSAAVAVALMANPVTVSKRSCKCLSLVLQLWGHFGKFGVTQGRTRAGGRLCRPAAGHAHGAVRGGRVCAAGPDALRAPPAGAHHLWLLHPVLPGVRACAPALAWSPTDATISALGRGFLNDASSCLLRFAAFLVLSFRCAPCLSLPEIPCSPASDRVNPLMARDPPGAGSPHQCRKFPSVLFFGSSPAGRVPTRVCMLAQHFVHLLDCLLCFVALLRAVRLHACACWRSALCTC